MIQNRANYDQEITINNVTYNVPYISWHIEHNQGDYEIHLDSIEIEDYDDYADVYVPFKPSFDLIDEIERHIFDETDWYEYEQDRYEAWQELQNEF